MACPFPAEQLKNLRVFIDLLKKNSNFLYLPELHFFKEYIESLGGIIPPKKTVQQTATPNQPTPKEAEPEEVEEEEEEELESEESEVELDYSGCIEPETDPPQTMGYTDSEVSEEDIEKSNERRQAAMELHSQQKYEDAINMYTEAILLNPTSALLYAKRGQCYLQLKKPNACIRDCSRALEINPDSAAAYKFRGRAHRLLGNFLKAAEDLRNACKIDFDEQADEWLKEVTPSARKLEEHQRKYERKQLEKEVKEARERIRRMREEQQKRASEVKESCNEFGGEGGEAGDPGLLMKEILEITNDPEMLKSFKDPEIEAALQDMTQDPVKIFKYANNPKVRKFLLKLSKYAPQKPFFSERMGQDPSAFQSFFGSATEETPEAEPPSNNIELD